MSGDAGYPAHLSDDEIDLYWVGRLPEERVRLLEEHYLGCPACLARVEQVESLVGGLRRAEQAGHLGREGPVRGRLWLGLAAAAVAGLALGWQVRALWGSRPQPVAVVAPGPSTTTAPERVAAASFAEFTLQPPVRSAASLQAIRIPSSARFVVLIVDAREAGPPGTSFDVRLMNARGLVAIFQALQSDTEGEVSAAVPSSLFSAGGCTLQLRRDSVTLEIPFNVEFAAAPP